MNRLINISPEMREWLIFDVTNPHFNYEVFVRAVEYPLVSSVLMGLFSSIGCPLFPLRPRLLRTLKARIVMVNKAIL